MKYRAQRRRAERQRRDLHPRFSERPIFHDKSRLRARRRRKRVSCVACGLASVLRCS
jgi:hypothetical protein